MPTSTNSCAEPKFQWAPEARLVQPANPMWDGATSAFPLRSQLPFEISLPSPVNATPSILGFKWIAGNPARAQPPIGCRQSMLYTELNGVQYCQRAGAVSLVAHRRKSARLKAGWNCARATRQSALRP